MIASPSVRSSAAAPSRAPAHKFLAGAGYVDCSARQMAEIYADVAGTFVLDARDADEAEAIEALGVRAVTRDVLMPDRASRVRLADEVLETLA